MKKTLTRILTLMTLLIFSASLTAAARAGSALDTILSTGTAQAFTADPVPDEDIRTILRAGISTASAINQQPWFFAAITDRELMKEIGGMMPAGGGAPINSTGALLDSIAAPPEGAGAPPAGESGSILTEGASGTVTDSASMPRASGGAKASLGDSPLAVIIYMDGNSKSPDPDFDCGLAAQNMVIAASALGYGVKIVSSPTRNLNGGDHDRICEKLGVDKRLKAVAVLLIGKTEASADAVSSASVREAEEAKSRIIH